MSLGDIRAYKKVGERRFRESRGLFFEDVVVGEIVEHRPGRTVTEADNVCQFFPLARARALAGRRRPRSGPWLTLGPPPSRIALGCDLSGTRSLPYRGRRAAQGGPSLPLGGLLLFTGL